MWQLCLCLAIDLLVLPARLPSQAQLRLAWQSIDCIWPSLSFVHLILTLMRAPGLTPDLPYQHRLAWWSRLSADPSCPLYTCFAQEPWGSCCHIVMLTSWLSLPSGAANLLCSLARDLNYKRYPARSTEMAKEPPESPFFFVKYKPPKGRRILEGWHCRPRWPA